MRFLLIALAVVGLDQVTKALALKYLAADEAVRVIGDFVLLTLGKNPGAAFSFLPRQTTLLVIVALVAAVAMVYYYRKTTWRQPLVKVGLALAFAGALGNLIDRLRFGYVVDFIAVGVWPVFNVADSAIVTGVALLIYHLWLPERGR